MAHTTLLARGPRTVDAIAVSGLACQSDWTYSVVVSRDGGNSFSLTHEMPCEAGQEFYVSTRQPLLENESLSLVASDPAVTAAVLRTSPLGE